MASDAHERSGMSVLVLGPFDGHNAADTATLGGLLQQLTTRLRGLHFIIPTFNPQFVSTYFADFDCESPQIFANPIRGHLRFWGPATLSVLDRCALVLTVGDIIFEQQFLNFHTNFVSSLIPLLRVIARKHIPVLGYGLGITAAKTWLGQQAIRYVLTHHTQIFVSQHNALPMLQEWALPCSIEQGVDAALVSSPSDAEHIDAILAMHMVNTERPIVMIQAAPFTGENLSQSQFETCLAEVITYFKDTLDVTPVLVCTSADDHWLAQHIVRQLNTWVPILTYPLLSHADIIGVLARAELVLAMNPQGCTLAAAGGTPVVSLSQHPAVLSSMHMLDLGKFTARSGETATNVVQKHLAEAWAQRKHSAEVLYRRMRQLSQLMEVQNNAVVEMLDLQRNKSCIS